MIINTKQIWLLKKRITDVGKIVHSNADYKDVLKFDNKNMETKNILQEVPTFLKKYEMKCKLQISTKNQTPKNIRATRGKQ